MIIKVLYIAVDIVSRFSIESCNPGSKVIIIKQQFKPVNLRKASLIKLDQINQIIEEYQAQSYNLTLRQLYYQLVSRNIIANTLKEYANLGILLTNARMMGLVDWNAIEDRGRVPHIPYCCDGVSNALMDTINQYRIDRQTNQDVYVEVWSEKDALSGILYQITSYYHVRLMVNKGYSSSTAMYDAAKRFRGKNGLILYLGDHDPSGEDMVRDIKDRLDEFKVDVEVRKIALTIQQVHQYKPPANYAKVTDARYKKYMEKYGTNCWEVDALRPDVLNDLLHTEIQAVIDMDKLRECLALEEEDRNKLLSIAKDFIN